LRTTPPLRTTRPPAHHPRSRAPPALPRTTRAPAHHPRSRRTTPPPAHHAAPRAPRRPPRTTSLPRTPPPPAHNCTPRNPTPRTTFVPAGCGTGAATAGRGTAKSAPLYGGEPGPSLDGGHEN
ncbi:hypothetical protein ABGB17_36600, partial [Sphaerisporangium sp. B11E5]